MPRTEPERPMLGSDPLAEVSGANHAPEPRVGGPSADARAGADAADAPAEAPPDADLLDAYSR
ncbi:MAG TPA: hypothetical protein VI792_05680, partial [Candidatus Eisenbacteria bacterium]